jgi:hypothetical protein
MLFWSELVEGGAALRQQVFLNAGIIARRKDGSKQGSIPIHPTLQKFPCPHQQGKANRSEINYFALQLIMNLIFNPGVFPSHHTSHAVTPIRPRRGHPIRSY